MKYSQEDKKRYLVLQCRYYKGESSVPHPLKDAPSEFNLFWDYERLWVEWSLKGDQMIKSFEKDITAFNLESKEGDNTPLTLKALLLNRYLHWGGNSPIEEELKAFENWYAREYQKWETNRDHRADKRWPGLVNQCRYFKNEEENPWTYCYSPVLVWRREMWEIEKKWCKALSKSYNCAESSETTIKELELSEIIKKINKTNIPLSLLNYIITIDKEARIQKNERYWKGDAIIAIEKYIRYAPLGRDHRMYFAFYLGEDICPFNYDREAEYKRMGWSQEQLLNQPSTSHDSCNFDSQEFQEKYRGLEGIWGWYADPKFPKAQREILYFAICNWGSWVPYCDEDKLAEEYLNYHYPGEDLK